MSDRFSLYQADGFWGIIEDSSDEKQTSVKSYIGADLIIKRLNEQAKQINQLKQQLEEYKNKENTSAVNSWDEMLKNCENCGLNECIGCEYTQTCVQNIKQQLAEKEKELLKQKEKSARTEQIYNGIIVNKDKEIEKLKQQYTILENENGKLTTELIMDKYKKAKKEVSFGKQLAIQELEKVKTLIQNAINFETNFVGVYDAINNQIKELKGEKE